MPIYFDRCVKGTLAGNELKNKQINKTVCKFICHMLTEIETIIFITNLVPISY